MAMTSTGKIGRIGAMIENVCRRGSHDPNPVALCVAPCSPRLTRQVMRLKSIQGGGLAVAEIHVKERDSRFERRL